MTSIQILAVYCLVIITIVFSSTIKNNFKNLKNPTISNIWISIVFFLPMFTLIIYCLKI